VVQFISGGCASWQCSEALYVLQHLMIPPDIHWIYLSMYYTKYMTNITLLDDESGGNRDLGLSLPEAKNTWIFLKFLLYSGSPTLYLPKSLTIKVIRPELKKLCSMIKQGIWAQISYFKNHHYFSKFLYIRVALYYTFLNHSKLYLYNQK